MEASILNGNLVFVIETDAQVIACRTLGLPLLDSDFNPTNNVDNCKYAVIKRDLHKYWTVLYSSYRIGDKVYLIYNNKITKGVIRNIVIATGNIDSCFIIEVDKKKHKFKQNEFFRTPQDLVIHLSNKYCEKEVW